MSKFDEMYNALPYADGAERAHYQSYAKWLKEQPLDRMQALRDEAELVFRRVGITFAV